MHQPSERNLDALHGEFTRFTLGQIGGFDACAHGQHGTRHGGDVAGTVPRHVQIEGDCARGGLEHRHGGCRVEKDLAERLAKLRRRAPAISPPYSGG